MKEVGSLQLKSTVIRAPGGVLPKPKMKAASEKKQQQSSQPLSSRSEPGPSPAAAEVPYTIADVIKSCANSTIVNSAASPNSNYIVDDTTYAELWGRACSYFRKVRG